MIFPPILDPLVVEFLRDAQSLGAGAVQGVGCNELAEPMPKYDDAPCEKVISGKNNSYIILGRDRPGTVLSGMGGAGKGQCGMIDLVVGRASSVINQKIKKYQKSAPDTSPTALAGAAVAFMGDKVAEQSAKLITGNNVVDSNFFSDAARIYLTQRAIDIDKYLGFQNDFGSSSKNLSAAVVKSDCTRIVGRESVRIYAGGASADGQGPFGEKRADHTDINNATIELIVGHKGEEKRQEAVLGKNLVLYLTKNNKIHKGIYSIFQSIMEQLSLIQTAFAFMDGGSMISHYGPENIKSAKKLVDNMVNQVRIDADGLDEYIAEGKNSILSKNVYLT